MKGEMISEARSRFYSQRAYGGEKHKHPSQHPQIHVQVMHCDQWCKEKDTDTRGLGLQGPVSISDSCVCVSPKTQASAASLHVSLPIRANLASILPSRPLWPKVT